jgi:hypothetical protein
MTCHGCCKTSHWRWCMTDKWLIARRGLPQKINGVKFIWAELYEGLHCKEQEETRIWTKNWANGEEPCTTFEVRGRMRYNWERLAWKPRDQKTYPSRTNERISVGEIAVRYRIAWHNSGNSKQAIRLDKLSSYMKSGERERGLETVHKAYSLLTANLLLHDTKVAIFWYKSGK